MSRRKNYKRFSRTDSGNAELFSQLYKGKILFDHKQRRWLIWDANNCRWAEDKTGQVREFAKGTAQGRYKMASSLPNGTDEERSEQKREARWAIDSQGLYRIDAALELAKSVPAIADAGDRWDADAWVLGVANGIVDLHTGTLRPVTQKDRTTKFSPVAFDVAAQCPRFEQSWTKSLTATSN